MQESGDVVAMTGDAVNDAAALKQADVGVAMGSGSEVTKQAAKIVLTDDNFATLVQAVDLGRDIYRRITSYVKLQLTILSSVLQLMLLATIFNINGGVALFPMQLLFCKFFVVVTVVIGFIVDVPDPGVMERPPRTPGTRIVNRPQIVRWVLSGFVVAVTALGILQLGPDDPSTTTGSASMTMAFALVALSAVNLGLVMRREREPAWSSPVFPYLGWIILGWTLTWAAVELTMLQRLLDTVSLTGERVARGARSLARHAGARPHRQDDPAAPPGGDGRPSGTSCGRGEATARGVIETRSGLRPGVDGGVRMTKQEKRILKYADLFRVKPGAKVTLADDFDPGFTADVVRKKDARPTLRRGVALLADYQARLAAQDTFGVLVCLQSLDAGGKDGTIRHVMSGVNPQGVAVHSFKVPSPRS